MAQAFATFDQPAEVLLAQLAGTGASRLLYLPTDLVITWAGTPETIPAGAVVHTLPADATALDPTSTVWLIVAWKGGTSDARALVAIDQALQGTLDALLIASPMSSTPKIWAIWGRYADRQLVTQQQSPPGMPDGTADGDTLTWDNTAKQWILVHIP